MQALVDLLARLLTEVGPWIVLLVTFAETAFFVGVLIPAEPVILMAAFLAGRGYFSIWAVLAATFVGGFLGDQTGYWLGRTGGGRLIAKEGRIAKIWRRHEPRAARLFSKHTSLSVSLARFISFVRTLMPWFAGMTGMPYARYVVYDFIGVLGWAVASVALGYLAGESWEAAMRVMGRTTIGVVAGVTLIALIVTRIRKKRAQLQRPDLRVALTGNIASGKSAVIDVWEDLGADIIDADLLARQAVEPGTSGYATLVQTFGEEIVTPDRAIDRARLRAIVLADPDRRARLEAIVHPEVARLRAIEEQKLVAEGAEVVVNDIPLLFEAGLEDEYDLIVLVQADEAVRLRRLIELRQLSEPEASALMAAQMPAPDKVKRAHIVITNNGTLEELQAAAADVWQQVQGWPTRSA